MTKTHEQRVCEDVRAPVRQRRMGSALSFVWVVCAIGCGDSASDNSTVVLRDSAGIQVVENGVLPTTASGAWRVGSEPLLTIGMEEGEEPYELFGVRDARRLRGGTIVVANSGSGELRFFDEIGSHLRTVGGQGDGPGEYRSLAWVQQFAGGDSLAVYDPVSSRVSVLDIDGDYMRSFTPKAPGENPRAETVSVLDDGTALARYGEPVHTSQDSTRVERISVGYGLFGADGSLRQPLGVFLGDEQFIWADGRGVSVGLLPFGRTTSMVSSGDRLYVAENRGFRIDVYDHTGTLVRSIRADAQPRTLTEIQAERHREQRIAALTTPFLRRLQERSIRATPYPATLPAYGVVLADGAGHLWVQLQAVRARPTIVGTCSIRRGG